jgi:hypothetical protein
VLRRNCEHSHHHHAHINGEVPEPVYVVQDLQELAVLRGDERRWSQQARRFGGTQTGETSNQRLL